MIAILTRRRMTLIAKIVAGFVAVAAVFALIWPNGRDTYRGALGYWLWMLPVGLLFWLALEWLVNGVLDRPWLRTAPDPVRLVYAVVAVSGLMVTGWFVIDVLRSM